MVNYRMVTVGNKQYPENFINGLLTLYYDGGNNFMKMVSWGGQNNTEIQRTILPHLIVEITESEYEREKHRNAGRFNVSFIKWKKKFYIVGEAGFIKVRGQIDQYKKVAAEKYTRDYYGLLFLHTILTHTSGTPPEAVNVFGAFPPMNDHMRGEIFDSLAGRWKGETFNGAFDFTVVTVDSQDEVMGASFNTMLDNNGRTILEPSPKNPKQMIEKSFDGMTLLFDAGGGTVDVVLVNERGFPVAGTHASVRVGINDIITDFKTIFDKEGPNAKKNRDGLPVEKIYKIFLHPEKMLEKWGGVDFNCSEIFEEAASPTLAQLYSLTRGMISSLEFRANQVLVTGGGGDLLFKEIKEIIFPNFAELGKVHLAGERGEVVFTNVTGLAKFGKVVEASQRGKEKKGR